MATIISTKTSGVGGLSVTGDGSGVLQLASADGTTAVTIDASQNVGIGTSSPTGRISVVGSDAGSLARIDASNGTVKCEMIPYSGLGYYGTTTSHPVVIQTAGTEKMRIDSAGNVGIGTSSPTVKLDVVGDVNLTGSFYAKSSNYFGATNATVSMQHYTSTNWNYSNLNLWRNATNTSTPRFLGMPLDGDSDANTTIGGFNAIWGAYDSAPTTGSTSSGLNGKIVYGAYAGHQWYTNGSERMRIDSSGNLLVGGATAAAGNVTLGRGGAGGGAVQIFNKPTSGATNVILNYYGATFVGGMNMDNTSTSFLTSSDERLKENIIDAPSAIDSISSIQIRSFDWIGDASHQTYGVIAQEVQSIAPECVCEGQTPEDTWGVDYSKLTPRLVKAIQEQQTLIEALTARLTALEAK